MLSGIASRALIAAGIDPQIESNSGHSVYRDRGRSAAAVRNGRAPREVMLVRPHLCKYKNTARTPQIVALRIEARVSDRLQRADYGIQGSSGVKSGQPASFAGSSTSIPSCGAFSGAASSATSGSAMNGWSIAAAAIRPPGSRICCAKPPRAGALRMGSEE